MPVICSSTSLILSRVPYQENDLVLGLLTRNEGTVTVVARSARNSRRRFAGVLDLFIVFEASWSPGRGSMPVLAHADPVRFFPGIHDSLQRLEAGQAMLKAVREMGRDAPPSQAMFDGLVSAFGHLEDAAPDRAHLVLLDVVLAMAAELGHAPSDGACPLCGNRSEPFMIGDDGTAACRRCVGPGATRALHIPPILVSRIPLSDNLSMNGDRDLPDARTSQMMVTAISSGVSGLSYSSHDRQQGGEYGNQQKR